MSKLVKPMLFAAAAIAGAVAISMMTPRELLAQVRAALVRDVDHPARQPVYLRGSFQIVPGNLTGSDPLQICTGSSTCVSAVPAGKRLVIEFITVRISAYSTPSAIITHMVIRTDFGPGNTEYYLDVPFQGTMSNGDRLYRANHMVRMYSDPGGGVFAQSGRSPTGELANVTLGGTGYLVDLN